MYPRAWWVGHLYPPHTPAAFPTDIR